MYRIVVCNAGAATLKLALMRVNGATVTAEQRMQHEWSEAAGTSVMDEALAGIEERPDAIGHRIVHGGPSFEQPVQIDEAVLDEMEGLKALAPLHNARSLELVRAAGRAFPDIPGYALFDTAFHARRSPASMRYALPAEIVDTFALRRYGFHGIAHASLVEALAVFLGTVPHEITAVTLQLGSGCSACAIDEGRSVETSMGFTPLEGLVMPSRCGDIDPAIVLRLIRAGYHADEVERQLTRQSGLLGLGGSSDMRELLAAESGGDESAALAIDVFVRRIVMTVGAYLTLLGGRGMLVFGGGIGTHSPVIRRRIMQGLRAFDVKIDTRLNEQNAPGRISTPAGRGVFVFETDEETMIAREVARMLDQDP